MHEVVHHYKRIKHLPAERAAEKLALIGYRTERIVQLSRPHRPCTVAPQCIINARHCSAVALLHLHCAAGINVTSATLPQSGPSIGCETGRRVFRY